MTARTVLIAGGGTGGHLMPALAVAASLRAAHPDWRVVLVGAERGIEATLLPTRDFPFILLPFEPLYRRQWWKNFRWPWLAIRIYRQVAALLDRERPALVMGTGGYAAGPVVWLAAKRGIPTAMLEQDAYPGLVTRGLAGSVREIYLGAPEAADSLKPGRGTVVVPTGSPIAVPDRSRRPAAVTRFGVQPGRPVVLVLGGSQGSVAINDRVAAWIDGGGADRVTIIWATGRGSYDRFQGRHKPPNVHVVDFLDPVADGYAVADLVVGRSGMMTMAEVAAWGLPSILIPLPSAAADHQTKNARVLAEAGAALVLPQALLTAETLGATITELLADRDRLGRMAAAAAARGRPGALADITARLEALIGT